MPNLAVEYLYRDAANYKKYGKIVLNGAPKDLEAWKKKLTACLSDGEYFIAGQVDMEEMFLWDGDYPVDDDDHCWHEMGEIYLTDETSTEAIIPERMLEMFQKARKDGWKIFDPKNR